MEVQALDYEEAQATGSVCGKSGTSDVVDASLVLLARSPAPTRTELEFCGADRF